MEPVSSARTPINKSRDSRLVLWHETKLSAKMEAQAQVGKVDFFTQRRFELNRSSLLNMVP